MAATIDIGTVQAYLRLRDEMTPALDLAFQKMGRFGREAQIVGRQVSEAGLAMSKIALPIALAGGAALKAAIDFESGFAGVRKTVKGTDAELDRLALGFRKLATEMPLSVIELTRVGEAAGQLGIRKDHILSFTATMAKLGATTNLSADEASMAMARFANIMATPQEEIDKVAAALVALGNDGASTESEIVEMALRIAGAGKTIGMTEGDVLGLANALSSVGIHAEMGGSAISRVMIDVARSVNTGGQSLQDFARVAKMSAEDFRALFNRDSGAAMSAFLGGLTKIKAEGGNLLNTLEQLGFSEIRVRDTLLRAANAGDVFTESMKLGNEALRSGNALNDEYQRRLETTASQLRLVWNQINDVAIELGGAMLPVLRQVVAVAKDLIPYVKSLAEWFATLPAPVKTGALAIGALVVAVGPLVWILGQLITAVGAVSGAFGMLAGASAMGAVTAGAPGVVAAISNIGRAAAASRSLVLGLGFGLAGLVAGGAAAVVSHQRGQLQNDLDAQTAPRNAPIAGNARNLLSIHDAQVKAAMSAAALKAEWSATLPVMQRTNVAAAVQQDTFAALGAELKQAEAEIKKLSATQRADLSRAILSGAFEMEALKEKTGLSSTALKLFSDRVKDSSKALAKDLKQGVDEGLAAIDHFQDRIVAAKGAMANDLAWLKGSSMRSSVLAPAYLDTDGGFRNIKPLRNTPFTSISGASLSGGGVDMRGRAVMDDLFASMPDAIMGAIQGGGSKLQAAGSAIGMSLFGKDSKLTSTITSGITKAFGTEGMMGKIGSQLGSMVPVIGSLLGPAIQGIAKLFGKSEESAKVSPVRDEFFKLQNGLESLNPKILQATGSLKLVEAVFAAKTVDSYTAAVRDVEAALGAYQQKLDLAAVSQQALSDRMIHATAISPEIRAALDAAYDSTNPDQYLAALQNINSLLDEEAAKHQFLEQTMQKYGLSWTDLGEKARAAAVAQTTSGITKEFDALMGAGANVNTVMRHMGKSINTIVAEARVSQTEVPESFRRIIQAAIDAGQIFDDNKNKITDMKDAGITFGTSMETVQIEIRDAMRELATVLRETLSGAFRDVSSTARKELDTIPRDVRVNVRANYKTHHQEDDGGPGFATGTQGRFLDFGTGTRVTLHGKERVVTEAEGRAEAKSSSGMEAKLGSIERLLERQPRAILVALKSAKAQGTI